MKPGQIIQDWFDDGVRCLIMRGPSALCVYLGVPLDHPLANHSSEHLPMDCHGGLTYSDKGGGDWPEGYWWYGWDYAHCDDACVYQHKHGLAITGHQWTVADVKKNMWGGVYDFRKLIHLTERVAQLNKDTPHD